MSYNLENVDHYSDDHMQVERIGLDEEGSVDDDELSKIITGVPIPSPSL